MLYDKKKSSLRDKIMKRDVKSAEKKDEQMNEDELDQEVSKVVMAKKKKGR